MYLTAPPASRSSKPCLANIPAMVSSSGVWMARKAGLSPRNWLILRPTDTRPLTGT